MSEDVSGQEQAIFGRVFEAMPDGILVADRSGRIVEVNRQLLDLSGYTREELLGQQVELLVPERFGQVHVGHRRSYHESSPGRRPMGTGLEIFLRRKNGGEFAADIALSPLEVEGAVFAVAAVRDVTERKRVERRNRAMLQVAQSILSGGHQDDVVEVVARSGREILGGATATLAVPEDEGDGYLIRAADGHGADLLRGRRIPLQGSILAGVLPGGGPLIVDDLMSDPRSFHELVDALRLGPALYLPLQAAGGAASAVLTICNIRGQSPFTPQDADLMGLFTAQAAVALEYARVRDELQRLALVEERERIGRELHDGVVQSLFAVGMGLQAAEMLTVDAELRQRLGSAVNQLDQVIRDLRNYIFGLRPGILADRALDQALRHLAAEFEEQSGVTTIVDIDARVAAELTSRSADIVQMASEAFSNIGRHAQAMTCRLTLRSDGDGYAMLEVEDDGRGFEMSGTTGMGQGLRNFRERAEGLGGEMDIESAPGEGTTLRIRLPI